MDLTLAESSPVILLETPSQIEDWITYQAQIHKVNVGYALKIAKCESNFNPKAVGDSGKSKGIWQIYSKAHPEISEDQAFDVVWSTEWAMNEMSKGNYNIWTCHKLNN